MFKTYFKQAIHLLAQNKFISIITILGTALAVMMIMSIIVVDQLKNSNMAPESSRASLAYVQGWIVKDGNGTNSGNLPYVAYKEYLSQLKTPKRISTVSDWVNPSLANREGSNNQANVGVRTTDAVFWEIMDFKFREGRAYSQEEFDAGVPNAVISKTTQQKIFGNENAVGQTIILNAKPYKVVGVVDDVSPIFKVAVGDVWIPYTSQADYETNYFTVLLQLDKRSDYTVVKDEVKAQQDRYHQVNGGNKTAIFWGPDLHRNREIYASGEDDKRQKAASAESRKQVFILVMLLLIPAVNMSGFSMSRIKKRTDEIGVRKAFGAKRRSILTQVLYENLITSLIGGFVGLLLSYGMIYQFRFWLLGVPKDTHIPVSGLISPAILLAVVVACILINLLSAGLPAYRASKMSIVHSLTQKDR